MRAATSWGGRGAAVETVAALRRWERPGDCGWQLHAGDVGWHLRHEDDTVDDTLLQVRDDAVLAAVGLLDGPAVVRLAIDPRLLHDAALASAVADAARDVPGVAAVSGPADVTDRVAVQRAAFDNSTFTETRWAQMAGSTAYDPSLDLLARDEAGTPVAALTAWTAGEGRCALVEPMGTAAGHRREGHGRRLLEGAAAALARAGASGVAVWTSAGNETAVAAYRSAGFSAIGVTSAMCSTA